MKKAIVAWSGGKDSAYGLYEVQQSQDIQVIGLITTVSEAHDRISVHGVRTSVLEQQAAAIGLPLTTVSIPENCTETQYDELWADALQQHAEGGIELVVFSDIFMSSARDKRERQLQEIELDGRWPLWKKDTQQLIQNIITAGFKATTVCIDRDKLDASLVGKQLDATFLESLPKDVDPCGEYGEYHTFVWDGPIFNEPVPIQTGEIVEREVANGTHCYCDIVRE